MLCGLFNEKQSYTPLTLLKKNSSGGQSNLISWGHFNSLQSFPFPDSIYRHKLLTKGITPQEGITGGSGVDANHSFS